MVRLLRPSFSPAPQATLFSPTSLSPATTVLAAFQFERAIPLHGTHLAPLAFSAFRCHLLTMQISRASRCRLPHPPLTRHKHSYAEVPPTTSIRIAVLPEGKDPHSVRDEPASSGQSFDARFPFLAAPHVFGSRQSDFPSLIPSAGGLFRALQGYLLCALAHPVPILDDSNMPPRSSPSSQCKISGFSLVRCPASFHLL